MRARLSQAGYVTLAFVTGNEGHDRTSSELTRIDLVESGICRLTNLPEVELRYGNLRSIYEFRYTAESCLRMSKSHANKTDKSMLVISRRYRSAVKPAVCFRFEFGVMIFYNCKELQMKGR